jgi:hypothetical protein
MILRSLNGRVEGVFATRPKLKLMRSSWRSNTDTRILVATATSTPWFGSSRWIKRPRTMALMMKITATSTRYAVSQWRQCRRKVLNRTPDCVEKRDAWICTSRSSWHVTMAKFSEGWTHGGMDSASEGTVVTVAVTILAATKAGFFIDGMKARGNWCVSACNRMSCVFGPSL